VLARRRRGRRIRRWAPCRGGDKASAIHDFPSWSIQLPIRYRVHPPPSGITVNDGEAALPVWASTAVQVAVSSYGAACRP